MEDFIMNVLKNVFLFLAAPFIALAYIFALPIVGLYAVVNSILEILDQKYKTAEKYRVWKKHIFTH